jgi:peptide/nickel transport system permease protein
MRRYVARRLGLGVITLAGALILVFLLTHYVPGNPALVKAGQYGSPEAVAAMKRQMGLDEPLPQQFVHYITGLFRLDLGTSYNSGHPVVSDLGSRIGATAELALWATAFAVSGTSIPLFWLGLVLVFVFYAKLGVVPAPDGRLSPFVEPPPTITGSYVLDSLFTGQFGTLGDAFQHLLLPVATLAVVEIAPILKIARAATIDVMNTEYVTTARALGLGRWQIVRQDVLRNVGVQLFTIIGIVLGYLLAGSVLVERIFNWPGIGLYAWNAMLSNDLAAVQGFILLVAAIYIVLNMLIDVLYAFVDPRIRFS